MHTSWSVQEALDFVHRVDNTNLLTKRGTEQQSGRRPLGTAIEGLPILQDFLHSNGPLIQREYARPSVSFCRRID